jgi:hypothetical protein
VRYAAPDYVCVVQLKSAGGVGSLASLSSYRKVEVGVGVHSIRGKAPLCVHTSIDGRWNYYFYSSVECFILYYIILLTFIPTSKGDAAVSCFTIYLSN